MRSAGTQTAPARTDQRDRGRRVRASLREIVLSPVKLPIFALPIGRVHRDTSSHTKHEWQLDRNVTTRRCDCDRLDDESSSSEYLPTGLR
jgi:hypothetical protein